VTAVVSLGSNLGDRLAHLRGAVEVLRQQVEVLAVSPVYETDPVGGPEQPRYLNCVAIVGSDDAELVFTATRAAEEARGRLRPGRWQPRTLDADVVSVDARVSTDPRLTLPHPRAHERAFVLVPWLDVEPDAVLPGRGPVRRLVRELDRSGIRRVAGMTRVEG
jgi:2-amino-4-hydroxy-6-hydroxymethyldihydropteridine diphosphokinase